MHNSDVSRVFLGRPISAGDLVEGTVMPLGVQGKALVGSTEQSSWKLQEFSTPKSLTSD